MSAPPNIRVLPDGLVNKIAAGEVVERPASVVKELVENSLDAGAGTVEVEVRAGGRSLIRVRDDGAGMGRDDALLCVLRHATSKLGDEADLFDVRTLGFRGEAIPSIAEVSRTEIRTCPRGADAGTRLRLEGGIVQEVTEAAAAPGTEVSVRNLFFNVPVRLKFLKGDRTELAHVEEAVTRLALARPDVAFTLVAGETEALRAPRTTEITRRAADVLGRGVGEALRPVLGGAGKVRVRGLASEPSLTRSTRDGLYLYVNGRFVRDRIVSAAVLDAYQGAIPRGRYPVVVLFVDLPGDQVDVNVHPAKTEVRFVRSQEVFRAVVDPLRDALRREASGGWTPEPPPPVPASGWDRISLSDRDPGAASLPLPFARREPLPLPGESPPGPRRAPAPPGPPPPPPSRDPRPPASPAVPTTAPPPLARPGPDPATPGGAFSRIEVIGALDEDVLLGRDGGDLVFVHLGAARERLVYEEVRSLAEGDGEGPGLLLVPEVIDLPEARVALLEGWRDLLLGLGLEAEPFGPDCVAVKTVPPGVDPGRVRVLVDAILGELPSPGDVAAAEGLRDRLASLVARLGPAPRCAAPGPDEARTLLSRLDGLDLASPMPGGRPLRARMSRADVDRWLSRG